MIYVGLDIHKKSISVCVRRAEGTILQQGTLPATRAALDDWTPSLPTPWTGGMEATLFTAWVYDHLAASGMDVKVAHPAMLRAIFAGKRKNDRIDAQKLADLLRCDYFPECHIATKEARDRRRILRYRSLLVRQSTQTKNKLSGLLMETGIPYKQKLHHSKKYFRQLLDEQKAQMPDGLPAHLRLGRNVIDVLRAMDRQLLRSLESDPRLVDRVRRLMTIPGVGPIWH